MIIPKLIHYLHMAVILAALVGLVLSVMWTPWAVPVQLITMGNLMTNKCILTKLENDFRRKLGQKLIRGGWVNHYFIERKDRWW